MKQTKGAIGNLLNRYRAVLKKCHLLNTFGSLAVASMLVMGGAGVAQAAEDVAYGGSGESYSGKPAEVDHLMGGWLYVGGENVQPVERDPVAGQNITLDVNGGKIEEIIGGSYVKVSSDGTSNFNSATTIELGDIKTTIGSGEQGAGTTSEFVVGGSKIANDTTASLKTGNIELVIESGTFGNEGNTGGYELVVGGNYIKGMNDYVTQKKPISSTAGNVTVRVEDGTFHASVIGGSVAQSYGVAEGLGSLSVVDDSTSVIIDGGTFKPSASTNANGFTLHPAVVGGAMAYGANTSTVVNGNSSVVINGDEDVVAPTINGKVVAGSVVAKGALSAENKGSTTLTMNGGTVSDDLVGGGFVQDAAPREEGYNLTGTTSSVAVNGGTAKGEIIGGAYVRGNGSSSLASSSVTLSGGTYAEADASANKAQYIVGGSKAMAYARDSASTTTGASQVIVKGVTINDGAVVGGSVSKATATGVATSEVATSSVTVQAGTLAGVIGGSLSETYAADGGSATSTVGEGSSVVINGGTINNIQYGAESGNTGTLDASVVGGSVANGDNTTATVTGGTDVQIKGGTITDKVVAGSAAGHNGSVTVKGDTNLVMTDGTAGDLVGGNLVDGGTSKKSNVEGSTYVTFSGGTVEGDIMGGSYVRNAAATSIVEGDTHVTVSGTVAPSETQQWVENVFGGGKAMTNASSQAATANVEGTAYVTVQGDANIQVGLVAGGGMSRLQQAGGNATATVNKAVITVEGGTLAGVAGGGIAENRTASTDNNSNTSSATVGESVLNITGGTINVAKYGDVNRDDEPTVGIAVIGGGIAWSKDASTRATAQSLVEHAVTNISGDVTVKGDVVAAGLADGTNTATTVQDELDNWSNTVAELTITDGTIEGDVFAGGAAINNGTVKNLNVAANIMGGTIKGNVYAGNYKSASEQAAAEDSQIGLGIGPDATIGGNIQVLSADTDVVIAGGKVNAENAETQAGVEIKEGADNTIVTLGGDNAAAGIHGGFTSKAQNSTLAFVNYTGGQAPEKYEGFATLQAVGNSEVNLGAFDTQNNKEARLTLAGDGTFTAESVTASSTNALIVGDGATSTTLNVTKDLTTGNSVTVANMGTLSVDKDVVLEQGEDGGYTAKTGVGSTTVNGGGTYEITGVDSLSLAEATAIKTALQSDGSTGMIYLAGASISDLTTNSHDHYEYKTVSGAATVDQLLEGTVDVASAENTGINGGFKNVHLTDTNGPLVAMGGLTLAGGEPGTLLVMTGTDPEYEKGDLRIGSKSSGQDDLANGTNTVVTLGQQNADNYGIIGDVTMNAGDGKTTTLNVVGNGNAVFEAGDIKTNGSTNEIVVNGAHFITGNISQGDVYKDLDNLTIRNNGSLTAQGVAELKDVTLAGGTLSAMQTESGEGEATGGNITLSGTLSGQGVVDAEGTLSFSPAPENGGWWTDEDDRIWLSANDMLFEGYLKSDDGGRLVLEVADTLSTESDVHLGDDIVVAAKWNLAKDPMVVSQVVLEANGQTLIQVGQFVTQDNPEDGTPSTIDRTVSLNDNSLLLHGGDDMIDPDGLVQLRTDLDNNGYAGRPVYMTDKRLHIANDGKLVVGQDTRVNADASKVVFGENSVLVVDGTMTEPVFTAEGTDNTAYVASTSSLHADDIKSNTEITIFGEGFQQNIDVEAPGWLDVQTDTAMLKGTYDRDGNKVTFKVQDVMTEFPGLSEDLAPAVQTLYERSLNDVDSDSMGIRFLSRATNDDYLGRNDRSAAASTIESAARMAFAAAVPQMTKMASDSATNSVVNRMGFANPENGAKAMNLDGKLVDDKALGLALWIAPLWSNQTGFGMEAGNLDYGYNANIGGISLGADYTWSNNFRAGLMFNIGGGYAESSGDLSETTNSMTFWGVGAYGGWKYENFAVMGDVSYTSTWNSVDQDVDYRMGMGDLEADIQASAISAGLRFEYKLETQYLDLIPHVGARYMSINTWGYDVETNGGTVLEGDGFQQNIWTFPVGITFSKELEMNNDWYFKPSVDFTVIPAAGDIKAKEDVKFTGLPYSTEIETQMMDYFTWQGGVGLEFGNDNMSVGVNYTLQAGQNSTGHGVFGMFRYEF